MLRAMRNSTQNGFMKLLVGALFILLVLSFALWGIEDIFRSSSETRVTAEVGDIEINAWEFSSLYDRQTREVKRLLGDAFDTEKGRQMGYVDQVMGSLVNRALFQNAANDLGLKVGDAFVKQRILDDEAFHDDFGQFNELVFRQALFDNGYTEKTYAEGTRQDLVREQLIEVFSRGPEIPAAILDPLLQLRRERRSADTITIKVSTMEGFDTPDEETLKQYFEDNKQDLQSPELRNISYIQVTTDDLLDQIDIAEETLQELYQEQISTFTTPEERNLQQILLKDQATADQTITRLREEDADFIKIGKEVADLEENDVKLGWNQRDDLLENLVEPVFSATKGDMIGPIETPFGWHILKIEDAKDEIIIPFEEAKQELRQNYARQEALDVLYDFINRSEDSLASGATVEELSSLLGQPVETITGIAQTGQDITGASIDPLPPDPFLNRAFDLNEGDISETIETGDNGLIVIQVDQIQPPRPLSFDEAKQQIEETWIADKRYETARSTAEMITETINEGSNIQTLAEDYGLEVVGKRPFSRYDFAGAELPPPLVSELFTLQPGQAAMGEENNAFVVAQLIDIIPVGGDQESTDRAEVTDRLREDFAGDFLSQYGEILRRRYDIQIYDNAIDSLL